MDVGDHIHNIGLSNGDVGERHYEPITDFDFDAVCDAIDGPDAEEQVAFADAASAIKSILLWICASPNLTHCGARAAALLYYLDPIEAAVHKRGSFVAIARESGVTKQAVSKWLIELRDSIGLQMTAGKSHFARSKYRDAQIRAFAVGRHTAFTRKDGHARKQPEVTDEASAQSRQ